MSFNNQPVSADWLLANKDSVKVIDGSWAMRANRHQEYTTKRIPGAVFFDIDECSDHSSPLVHQLPSSEQFSEYCRKLGLNNEDKLVIYDVGDAFMSARVWQMFQLFGHNDATILNGGITAWISAGGAIDTDASTVPQPALGNFFGTLQSSRLRNLQDMKTIVADKSAVILDARPVPRFSGQVDEPRPGLLRGHMPGAVNLPFESLCYSQDVNGSAVRPLIKSQDDLRGMLDARGVQIDDTSKPIVCSCGSGVTACQLMWALHLLGRDDNVFLYPGSWSEWGAVELNLPHESS